MTALSDIQRLVECESPTEDLAACDQVIDIALDIAGKVLHSKA
jgi:glutamate carboxypeptidase